MFRAVLEGCAFAMRDVVDRLDRIGVAGASLLLLGGGTGAGKGRQIAACILDSWLQGRRRNIWISKNEALLEDARRDWTALGGLAADIQPLANCTIDKPIPLEPGVLFVTYPTPRSVRGHHSRPQPILHWPAPAIQ